MKTKPTGYCVPLTSNTRTRPSARTGAHFTMTDAISDVSGGLEYTGALMSGMADTTPWENTNAPTPMSIYSRAHLSRHVAWCKGKKKTHERDTIGLALCQRARKDGKVDREDREDGHEHHVRAIGAQRGQTRGLGFFGGWWCALSATVVAMETRWAERGGRCVGRWQWQWRAAGWERCAGLVWGEEEVEKRGW